MRYISLEKLSTDARNLSMNLTSYPGMSDRRLRAYDISSLCEAKEMNRIMELASFVDESDRGFKAIVSMLMSNDSCSELSHSHFWGKVNSASFCAFAYFHACQLPG